MTLPKIAFEEFENFRKIRFDAPPWDFPHNPVGFPPYKHGSSDISAHLETLRYFASQCNHVTEFGTRNCCSTVAFLSGAKKRVVSYDIISTDATATLEEMNKSGVLPCEWEFKLQSSVDENHQIEETDFLFLDTIHNFSTVEKELSLHAHRVSKYIGFHDTFTDWEKSLDVAGDEGIGRAIEEFLDNNKQFRIIFEVKYNHGLLIMRRID
jgi:hypothetical protein